MAKMGSEISQNINNNIPISYYPNFIQDAFKCANIY